MHHDLLVLPIGINHTVTQELGNPTDTVSSALGMIPVVGKTFSMVVKGFSGLLWGSAPFGLKKGGYDPRLNYYGNSMVGLMSSEFYYFYTGPYGEGTQSGK
jgi:hypothetical protein